MVEKDAPEGRHHRVPHLPGEEGPEQGLTGKYIKSAGVIPDRSRPAADFVHPER